MSNTKRTRTKTTYAERLAARKAKRNGPVHPLTVAARERRCDSASDKTRAMFAGDVPANGGK